MQNKPPSPPVLPSGFHAQYAVMAQYGQTMLLVQLFERSLAMLVIVAKNAASGKLTDRVEAATSSVVSRRRRTSHSVCSTG